MSLYVNRMQRMKEPTCLEIFIKTHTHKNGQYPKDWWFYSVSVRKTFLTDTVNSFSYSYRKHRCIFKINWNIKLLFLNLNLLTWSRIAYISYKCIAKKIAIQWTDISVAGAQEVKIIIHFSNNSQSPLSQAVKIFSSISVYWKIKNKNFN